MTSKVSLYKTKIWPIYNELNFFNLSNIYKLEVLKFSVLPNCFSNYNQSDTETHNYSTRFALDNSLDITKCNKSSTQQSI